MVKTVNEAQKAKIIKLRKEGVSYKNISRAVNISEATVWRVLKDNNVAAPEPVKMETPHSVIKPDPIESYLNANIASEENKAEVKQMAVQEGGEEDDNDFAEHLYALAEELEKADQENRELTDKLEESEKKLKNLKSRYDALEKGSEKSRLNQQNMIDKQRSDLERIKKEYSDTKKEYEAHIKELQEKKAEIPPEFLSEFDTFEKENKELKAKTLGLEASLNNLIQKQGQNGALITYGFEKDFFPMEIREYVLEILEEYIKNHDDGSRSRKLDCIKDVLESNGFQSIHNDRRETLATGFKKANNDFVKCVSVLEELGFSKVASNNHEKLIYFNDPRYVTVLPVTPSDFRAVKNSISQMTKEFL